MFPGAAGSRAERRSEARHRRRDSEGAANRGPHVAGRAAARAIAGREGRRGVPRRDGGRRAAAGGCTDRRRRTASRRPAGRSQNERGSGACRTPFPGEPHDVRLGAAGDRQDLDSRSRRRGALPRGPLRAPRVPHQRGRRYRARTGRRAAVRRSGLRSGPGPAPRTDRQGGAARPLRIADQPGEGRRATERPVAAREEGPRARSGRSQGGGSLARRRTTGRGRARGRSERRRVARTPFRGRDPSAR